MRPATFAALERADCLHGQARNCGQLLLRKARGLAKHFQVRPK
jgi:hypothetical protein